MAAQDVIRLEGIQLYAFHGVDQGERELGQRFEFEVELACDLSAPGRSDDLAEAINYREVYDLVVAAQTPPCRLIEAVAERIAQAILAGFPVAHVRVTVRKPSVPIGGVVGAAAVTVRRSRAD